MALILNIDTALDTAYIALAEGGIALLSTFNDNQKDHAGWIQLAVQRLIKEAGKDIRQLNAIGVCIGPGSYTGLRIGLSTAKGICYALNIPLITEVSLKIMAFSAIKEAEESSRGSSKELLFCPLIDARRMEVFTAIYDAELKGVMSAQSVVLKVDSFEESLKRQKILFLGNGAGKFQSICQHPNAIFKKIPLNPSPLCELTYKNFIGNNFADLTYTTPLYLKEFFTK